MSALGRDDELALTSLDFLGDTEQLRARAMIQVRAAGRGARAGAVCEAVDDTDSIRVAVDDRGGVRSVGVSQRWRERLAVGRFADGLFQAYVAAVRGAMEQAAVAALVAGADQRVAEGAAAQPSTAQATSAGPVDEHEWRAATWVALREIAAALERIRHVDVTAAAGRGRQDAVRSPAGLFILHLSGRAVAGISGEVRLIAGADVGQVRHEALAVLQAVPRPDRR